MNLLTFDGITAFLNYAFYFGFTLFCIVCLVLRILPFKNIKKEVVNIQASSNLAIAIGILFNIISWGILFYVAYSNQSNSYWFLFPFDMVVTCMILFWITGLLFFFKRFRKSWLLSLLALIFSNADTIIIFVTYFWRHYLPSSWTVYYSDDLFYYRYILAALTFSVLVLLSYLYLAKRKKLPYSSAWIR